MAARNESDKASARRAAETPTTPEPTSAADTLTPTTPASAEAAEAGKPVLETRLLAAGYDGSPAVKDLSLAVRPGQVVALIGPNGAGKSTVLKTLARLLEPVDGAVFVDGAPLETLSAHQLSLTMSVMLTERLRTELLTCYDIVATGRYPHTGRMGVLRWADRQAVARAMQRVDVWDLRERDFMALSDGQRQRILLARAICQEPRILVLDEPTSYLDVRYQLDLLNVLRALAAEDGTAVVSSLHELDLAWKYADYVVCLKDGAVFCEGTPNQVFTRETIGALYDLDDDAARFVCARYDVGL